MDPRDFHQLAGNLAHLPGAAAARSASSRAYYAAFNVGADLLKAWGFFIPPDGKAHGLVRNLFSNSGEQVLERAATQLQRLYDARVRADYRMENQAADNPNCARLDVESAGRIIQALDAFAQQTIETREPALRAMQAWLNRSGRQWSS